MNVEIRDLQKSYDGRLALDIGRLTLQHGEITAVVGPNGAGKSTLLNILAGLLDKDKGEILYDANEAPPYSVMTLVFQKPCLISTTVRGNLAYPLKLRHVDRVTAAARVADVAQALGLTDLLNKRADQLSLGEAQKTALGRALVFEPELLLLDEPCASIDPYTTGEIEKILKQQSLRTRPTIVIVTHNLAQAGRLADRVVLLDRGRLIEVGKSGDFFSHPQTEGAKRFIAGELLIENM